MAGKENLGEMIIKLSVHTVEMAGGLKKAEDMLASFKSTMQKILGGISLAVVGTKFAKAITDAKDYAAELSKMAEKVGVPVQALSRMADAAEDVGLDLGGLATGLKFLSRNMFEAAQGSGAAKEIFEALGVQFKNADGSLRPLEDTMLDLADIFSRMEDGPAKTAMALKLLGRSGQEMIPFLNKGREALREWMKDADAMGKTIDPVLGEKARAFNLTMKNMRDALEGISLSIMRAMLPALQSMAKWLLDAAVSMNSFRKDAYLVTEALRYAAAVIIPLFLLKLASMVSFVGIANLALRAFGATVAFLSGPVGWITAGIVALSVAWTYLGKGARDAAREHEKFADSVRSMKMDELKETLRDTELQLTLLIQKYQAMVDELERGDEFTLSLFKPQEADEAKKKIDELRDRIKILQGAIGDVQKAKIEVPPVTDTEAMKKLEERVRQLRTEMLALENPVKAAFSALQDFIDATTASVPMTDRLKAKIAELRAAFDALFMKQQGQKLWDVLAQSDLESFVAANERVMADMENQFAEGLLATRTFFNERWRIIAENAEREIANIKVALPPPAANPVVYEQGMAKIRAIRDKELADTQKANRDEVAAVRSAVAQEAAIRQAYLETVAAGQENILEQMRAAGRAELNALDEKHRQQREALKAHTEEMLLIEGEYLSKVDAMRKLSDAQDEERKKKKRDLEKEAIIAELGFQLQGVEALGQMFNTVYEMSGQKIKAFFYLQKAMAVAQVMIQTAIAVARLPADMPMFLGLPLAGVLWANAAASVAMIMAQTIKGMALGGLVRSGSGRKDDVPALLKKGEYVQTSEAVNYYGLPFMEAIRRMVIPREKTRGFGFFPVATPQLAYAGGGMVTGGGAGTTNIVNVGGVNVEDGNKRLASRMREEMEQAAIRVLREFSR